MISAFWMIGILFGIAGICTVLSRRRIEEWFAFAICAIVVVLYVFALCGVPAVGYQVVRALGIAALAAGLMAALRSCEVRSRFFTPGAVVFAVWMITAWWAHRGQMYNTYDEYNHWGTVINRLYVLGKLPTAVPGVLDYPSYPPGSSLFYCFYTWLGGNFSEGNTISAANILMVSCLMPLMKYVDWKHWKHMLPMGLVCVMLPMVFKPLVYQDLYVDILLGCLAAYALITWFASEHGSAAVWMISAALGVLCLTKESGMGIAVMVLVGMVPDVWKGTKPERKKVLLTIGAALACVLAASTSWKVFLSTCGVVSEKPFRIWEIAENTRSFLSGTAPGRLKSQYNNFFSHLIRPEMMGGGHILQLSYVEWMLALTLVACWLKHSGQEQNLQARRHGSALAVMMVLTAVYAVFLFHTYMYAFPYGEAASLHSFDRYMSSVMMPTVALGAAMAAKKLYQQSKRIVPGCLILLTCLALVVSPYYLMRLTFTAPLQISETQESRAQSAPAAYVLEKLAPEDKVAWLSVETPRTAFDFLINRYEFMPVKMDMPLSITVDETLEEVKTSLFNSDYTHAYCFRSNEEFVQTYGSLFENPQDIADTTLFEIIRTADGVMLRKVV